jgi:hypothetical protein
LSVIHCDRFFSVIQQTTRQSKIDETLAGHEQECLGRIDRSELGPVGFGGVRLKRATVELKHLADANPNEKTKPRGTLSDVIDLPW